MFINTEFHTLIKNTIPYFGISSIYLSFFSFIAFNTFTQFINDLNRYDSKSSIDFIFA